MCSSFSGFGDFSLPRRHHSDITTCSQAKDQSSNDELDETEGGRYKDCANDGNGRGDENNSMAAKEIPEIGA